MEKLNVKVKGLFRGVECNEESFEIGVTDDWSTEEAKEIARKAANLDSITNFEIIENA